MTSETKAPKPTKKPTSRRKTADKAQFERFVEAAREIGMDEDVEALERAFDKVARPKPSGTKS
jgi:hypothetical protein